MFQKMTMTTRVSGSICSGFFPGRTMRNLNMWMLLTRRRNDFVMKIKMCNIERNLLILIFYL